MHYSSRSVIISYDKSDHFTNNYSLVLVQLSVGAIQSGMLLHTAEQFHHGPVIVGHGFNYFQP